MIKNKKEPVSLVEVGMRDGLQNEATILSVQQRVEFAEKLLNAGIRRLELGAFVREDKVPQMKGSADVIKKMYAFTAANSKFKRVHFSALVPNEFGLALALNSGIKEIAVFAGCSETFSQKNINCSIAESLERFAPVIAAAKKKRIKVRGYLSTCFGCPYEGKVSEEFVVKLAKKLLQMGCYEISIGDTIGVAHPGQVKSLFEKLKKQIPVAKLAGHFHDTRGLALVNILTAYNLGVRVFDTSLGGLGGCPYAKGSSGNVATEEVVYMFEGMGIKTGYDLPVLLETNSWVSKVMNKQLPSKVSQAGLLLTT
jgi:hydroxymethylglutaryl-CoA lyase